MLQTYFLAIFLFRGIKKINERYQTAFYSFFVPETKEYKLGETETLPNRPLIVGWDKNKHQYANLPTIK